MVRNTEMPFSIGVSGANAAWIVCITCFSQKITQRKKKLDVFGKNARNLIMINIVKGLKLIG